MIVELTHYQDRIFISKSGVVRYCIEYFNLSLYLIVHTLAFKSLIKLVEYIGHDADIRHRSKPITYH